MLWQHHCECLNTSEGGSIYLHHGYHRLKWPQSVSVKIHHPLNNYLARSVSSVRFLRPC
jgi:hypothetical protein